MTVADVFGLIVLFLIIAGIPVGIIIGNKMEEKRTNKLYSLFRKGMTLEYYSQRNHGKFKKNVLIASYEILDSDGRYIWMKDKNSGKECETDLYFDCKYQDMILKDAEGNIVKTFKMDF